MSLRPTTELVANSVFGKIESMMDAHEPALRKCTACKAAKPESAFYSKERRCKPCVREVRRQYWIDNRERLTEERRAQYAADPERYRAEKRASTARTREAVLERQRAWWKEHGSANQVAKRMADPRGFRDMHLRSRYGITIDQYEEMLQRQGGLCAICHIAHEKLVVDHCHGTGRVRGLLCNTCNAGIGYLQDDPLLVFRAVSYLSGEVGPDGLAS